MDEIKWPDILRIDQQALQLTIQCRIPGELAYFDGHFAESPVLPGIVQVHWAEAFGRKYLPLQGRFVRLEQVKFQQVITPEMIVDLQLSYDTEKQKLSFSFDSEHGGHSSGRICFE